MWHARLHRARPWLLLALWLVAAPSWAMKPAILFNVDEVMDKSFSESIYGGMEFFQRKTGLRYELRAFGDAEKYEAALKALIAEGYSPILVPSNRVKAIVERVAPTAPNTSFIAIDYEIDLPNVYSILFNEQEGTFLAGVLAGLATKSNHIGFIGGMDIPVIRRFAFGFEQGIRYVNPTARLTLDFAETRTDRPWSSPDVGRQLAEQQRAQGIDVIFPAAGGTGEGVLAVMAENGLLGIGVDSNQNPLFPGRVLTSVIKNLERAVYVALVSYQRGLWNDRVKRLGIAQQGVDIVIDEYNRPLITDAMRDALTQARTAILLGTLTLDADRLTGSVSREKLRVTVPERFVVVGASQENAFPYLMGSADALDAEKPGLAVEALRLLAPTLGVGFEFPRRPWRRALNDLKEGRLDALIYTSYRPELEEFGVFPKRLNQIDERRRLLTERWNLYVRRDQPLDWQGQLFPDLGPVGLTAGAPVIPALEAANVAFDETRATLLNFRKLARGRVRSAISDDLNGEFILRTHQAELGNHLQALSLPVAQEFYYLIFSHSFYARYPEFAEILWNNLSSVRESVEFWETVDRYLAQSPLRDAP